MTAVENLRFGQGEILLNRFDEIAENWDDDPQKVERASAVARDIRRHVPLDAGMKALEFGCGTGLLSFALKDDLGHITLVDNSRGMVDVLKRKIASSGVKNMTPLLLDLTSGKNPGGETFDFIFTMMALHHIPRPENAMAALSGLLKERGWLAVAELEKGGTSFHGPDFEGHDGFSRGELSEMAAAGGFDVVRFSDCFVIRRDIGGTIENFNVFLLIGRKKGL